ncbi:MAG TPA: hypothetical protein VFL38_09915 [Humibacillus xanthopallidus]|nr:hypothetical protein [Humibacillus xanthopallidus]
MTRLQASLVGDHAGHDFLTYYSAAARALTDLGNPYAVDGYVYSPLVALVVAALLHTGGPLLWWNLLGVTCGVIALIATWRTFTVELSGWRAPAFVMVGAGLLFWTWPVTLELSGLGAVVGRESTAADATPAGATPGSSPTAADAEQAGATPGVSSTAAAAEPVGATPGASPFAELTVEPTAEPTAESSATAGSQEQRSATSLDGGDDVPDEPQGASCGTQGGAQGDRASDCAGDLVDAAAIAAHGLEHVAGPALAPWTAIGSELAPRGSPELGGLPEQSAVHLLVLQQQEVARREWERLASVMLGRFQLRLGRWRPPSVGVRDPRAGWILSSTLVDILSDPDIRLRVTRADALTGVTVARDPSVYRPNAALARRVRDRDRTCRFPGCSVSAHRCDLDHVVRYPDGPTTEDNLLCLCRTHHGFKHHAGWLLVLDAHGACTWTSPTGRSYVTRPADVRADAA